MDNRGTKRKKDQRVIRNRRVMIYTFLIIMVLFYISAHQTVEARRAAEAAGGLEVAGGAGGGVAGGAAGADGAAGGAGGAGAAGGLAGGSGNAGGPADGAGAAGGGDVMETAADGSLILREDEMWCLILTNAEYPVPEEYTVELKEIPGTEQSVDARIYEPLMNMMEAMESEGLAPVVCSGYRTLDKQEKLFNRKVSAFVKQGYSKEDARAQARQILSIPGSGEHCLGLAVDFCTKTYHQLEQEFEKTPEGAWLREHAQDYGFILRYEQGKEEITGIEYEPWHFRYVGVKAARYMKEHGQSLEEFYIDESLYG